MAISVYTKGVSHIVDDMHCKVVTVATVDEMNDLIAGGEHFHTVEEVYAGKTKKTRKPKTIGDSSEIVELGKTELMAGTDEDENSDS